jgi:hypothetical protein
VRSNQLSYGPSGEKAPTRVATEPSQARLTGLSKIGSSFRFTVQVLFPAEAGRHHLEALSKELLQVSPERR